MPPPLCMLLPAHDSSAAACAIPWLLLLPTEWWRVYAAAAASVHPMFVCGTLCRYDFFWDQGPHTDRHGRTRDKDPWEPITGP